jgi:NTP pyrophosphatase (non-canonical NTP hydrolase)
VNVEPARWTGNAGGLFPFGNTHTFGDESPDNSTPHAGARMDLRDVQRQVDAYISQFKEGYFPPLVNLARLTEEVGELARELNHRYGPKTKKPGEPEQDVALELADIIFVCVVLANQMGLDLQDAIERTLHKYEVRDADRWERK